MFDNLKISNTFRKQILTVVPVLINRRKESFTQDEIASLFEVSRPTISDFETGKTFNFELFENYCGLFGFEIHIFDNKHIEK